MVVHHPIGTPISGRSATGLPRQILDVAPRALEPDLELVRTFGGRGVSITAQAEPGVSDPNVDFESRFFAPCMVRRARDVPARDR